MREQETDRQQHPLSGAEYESIWTIPWNAQTGRYEVDLTLPDGKSIQGAGSFAVHRQLAKVTHSISTRRFTRQGMREPPDCSPEHIQPALEHLQLEFEAYTYPWIAPAADEGPAWKTIAAKSLSLEPGAEKEFRL